MYVQTYIYTCIYIYLYVTRVDIGSLRSCTWKSIGWLQDLRSQPGLLRLRVAVEKDVGRPDSANEGLSFAPYSPTYGLPPSVWIARVPHFLKRLVAMFLTAAVCDRDQLPKDLGYGVQPLYGYKKEQGTMADQITETRRSGSSVKQRPLCPIFLIQL